MVFTLTAYAELLGVMLGAGLALGAAVVALLAWSLACPPRMGDGKAIWVLKRLSPGDLGLTFEEVAFNIRDASTDRPLRIAGWWIPHADARGRCVVLLHGYADAKVGSIAWAPAWHSLGWNVLAIDLRAHGESGGRWSSGGYFERNDVVQVIDELRAQRPTQTKQIAFFGVSFGAAVAVAAAAIRPDLADAVVLDSPMADFEAAALIQMRRRGAPAGIIPKLAIRWAERMAGAKFGEARLIDVLPKIACPVMVISPEVDFLLNAETARSLDAILQKLEPLPGVRWIVPHATHARALQFQPTEYVNRLGAFLDAIDKRNGDSPRV